MRAALLGFVLLTSAACRHQPRQPRVDMSGNVVVQDHTGRSLTFETLKERDGIIVASNEIPETRSEASKRAEMADNIAAQKRLAAAADAQRASEIKACVDHGGTPLVSAGIVFCAKSKGHQWQR